MNDEELKKLCYQLRLWGNSHAGLSFCTDAAEEIERQAKRIQVLQENLVDLVASVISLSKADHR